MAKIGSYEYPELKFKTLLDDIEENPPKRGRPKLLLKDLIFCSILKVASRKASATAHSLYVKALQEGLVTRAPSYNMINKFLNRTDITPILERLVETSVLPLRDREVDFAIDSTGFRTTSFGAYRDIRYEKAQRRRHRFIKAHVCTGVKTNAIVSIVVTTESGADAPQFIPLIQTVRRNGFIINHVVADKAYTSKYNLECVDKLGGKAFIPFRSNTSGKSRGNKQWAQAFRFFRDNPEEFYKIYHARSNVEATFAAIKKKMGETLKSKNFVAQKNELLCKILMYNLTVLVQETYR